VSLRGTRVVVVGAGAIGACIGYQTARAGADVTVVERRFPGAGTTSATFATLGALAQSPRTFHDLHFRGIAAHERLANALGGQWLHLDGALFWDEEHHAAERLEAAVRQERAWGGDIRELSPGEVSDLEPDLSIAGRVGVVYRAPRDGWLRGPELASAIVAAAVERHGARYVRGTVSAIEPGVQVHLANGTRLAADVVVNAAGPDARRVAGLAGVDLALGRFVGAVVVSEPSTTRLTHLLKSTSTRVRPDGEGRLVFYGDTFGAGRAEDAQPDRQDPLGENAIAAARAVLPSLAGVHAESILVGVRAEPLDGLPITGAQAGAPAVYHAVTRSGITLAAILGELVAADLAGATRDLDPYRPGRLAPQAD
jgi:glycine/D-amino acid oxidase-like deaminating enzyme